MGISFANFFYFVDSDFLGWGTLLHSLDLLFEKHNLVLCFHWVESKLDRHTTSFTLDFLLFFLHLIFIYWIQFNRSAPRSKLFAWAHCIGLITDCAENLPKPLFFGIFRGSKTSVKACPADILSHTQTTSAATRLSRDVSQYSLSLIVFVLQDILHRNFFYVSYWRGQRWLIPARWGNFFVRCRWEDFNDLCSSFDWKLLMLLAHIKYSLPEGCKCLRQLEVLDIGNEGYCYDLHTLILLTKWPV